LSNAATACPTSAPNVETQGTLAQVSIYGVAAARWSILGGTALVRLVACFSHTRNRRIE
jgi:hypothetical protein